MQNFLPVENQDEEGEAIIILVQYLGLKNVPFVHILFVVTTRVVRSWVHFSVFYELETISNFQRTLH